MAVKKIHPSDVHWHTEYKNLSCSRFKKGKRIVDSPVWAGLPGMKPIQNTKTI